MEEKVVMDVDGDGGQVRKEGGGMEKRWMGEMDNRPCSPFLSSIRGFGIYCTLHWALILAALPSLGIMAIFSRRLVMVVSTMAPIVPTKEVRMNSKAPHGT
jgi:hypothetical protein